MEKKKGYVGQIKNSGSQHVKAPFSTGETKKGNAVKKTGTDLRSGK